MVEIGGQVVRPSLQPNLIICLLHCTVYVTRCAWIYECNQFDLGLFYYTQLTTLSDVQFYPNYHNQVIVTWKHQCVILPPLPTLPWAEVGI